MAASLVPTLAGSAALVWQAGRQQLLHDRDAWPSALGSLLGGTALVERVDRSGPGHATLVGVTIVDPVTGARQAWLPQLTIRSTNAAWELSSDLLVLEAEQLASLADHCLVLRRTATTARHFPPSDWTLTAHRVVLQVGPLQQTFQQAVISVARQQTDQPEARLTVEAFAAERDLAQPPLHLEWVRSHSEAGARSTGRGTTGSASVACRALAALWPPVVRLGAACEFRGDWSWSSAGLDRQLALRGELTAVDLDALVSEQFPHRLSGTAHVQIQQATVRQGRLSELRGIITAGEGMLSASLLAAAVEHLKLASTRSLIESPPAAAIPFQRLHVDFHLDGAHLTLRGSADPSQSGVLLTSEGRSLLAAPADHRVPAVALVRMLVPEADYQVPATRQTAILVRLLPVPDAPAGPSVAGRHTPTRLAPASQRDATATPPLRAPGLR